MKSFSTSDIIQELCKAHKKWGMYISISSKEKDSSIEFPELKRALPFFGDYLCTQILIDEQGWFLFDSQEECEDTFWQCVGDDGPTKTNPYKGPIITYAVTCSPEGNYSNENT